MLILAGVVLLLIVDALSEKSTAARVGVLVSVVAGGLLGAEVEPRWIAWSFIVLAFVLFMVGRAATRRSDP